MTYSKYTINKNVGSNDVKVLLFLHDNRESITDYLKGNAQRLSHAEALTIRYLPKYYKQAEAIAECHINLSNFNDEMVAHEATHLAFAISLYCEVWNATQYEEWFCGVVGEITYSINKCIQEKSQMNV